MDTKEKERILEKIKKCLALAKSTNPHEAAQALKQAYALMKKHNVDESIADISEITRGESLDYSNTKSGVVYLDRLLGIVQRCFDVNAVQNIRHSYRTKQTIRFIGNSSDVMIAEYAWAYLARILKKSRAEFIKNLSYRYSNATKTKKANIYAMGWCDGIYDELLTLRRTPDAAEYDCKYNDNQKYIDTLYGKLDTAKAKKISLENLSDLELEAYFIGASEAEGVSISRAVNGADEPTLLAI